MPTIELISIDCVKVPDLPRYESFAYIAEAQLRSHRALFQSVFSNLNGIIVHLANKDMEGDEDGVWFAGKIMDWKKENTLTFKPDTLLDVRDLMQRLICASPKQCITFSTDYQFGGERHEGGEMTLSQFFQRHAAGKLRYNSLWYLKPDV